METCQICFEDYLIENTKDHQCTEFFCCGACGENVLIEDGVVTLNNGIKEFTHSANECDIAIEEELNK